VCSGSKTATGSNGRFGSKAATHFLAAGMGGKWTLSEAVLDRDGFKIIG